MTQSTALILLDCLGYTSEAARTERMAQVSAEEWGLVAKLAQQHGVAPLLYYNLQKMNVALPSDIGKELKQAYLKNMLRMMRFFHDIKDLLQLMQENDIQVIVLKGAFLAEGVYDNIGLRVMGDIDLMVKKEDLERVDELLLAFGCNPKDYSRVVTQDNHHFGYRLPSGLTLEIHWSIINANLPFRIDVEGLWSRAQPITLVQTRALALAPEDLLVHLCLHTVIHTYEIRLRMVCDINEVVRRYGTQLNWQDISQRARQWGAVRAVYVILRYAQDLLGVPVPAGWLASLRPENFTERYLDQIKEQILIEQSGVKGSLQRATYFSHLSQLWGPKGLRSKLGLIHNILWPPRETIARLYPVPVNSWRIYIYYLVHLKNYLVRRGATLWRLVHGDRKEHALADQFNQLMALQDWLEGKD
jgi:hypothetical protein